MLTQKLLGKRLTTGIESSRELSELRMLDDEPRRRALPRLHALADGDTPAARPGNTPQRTDLAGRSPFPLRLWHWTTARVLYTATIYVASLYLFRAARETLTLFLFAILFAYFLLPLVNRLERPLRGRGRAIAVVYVLLLGSLTLLAFLVGPTISRETHELAASLPSLLNRLASGELVDSIGHHRGWTVERINQVQGFLTDHRDGILTYGKATAAKLATPLSHIWWLILIPILTLFFLKQGQEIASSIAGLVTDPDDHGVVDGLFADINVMLGSYIRSQIILSVFTLVAYTLVLSVMRVPYSFILGPLAGFLEFIPVVGPAVAAISVFGIAVLAGYPHTIGLIVFLGAWRLIQDYVSAPRIMGKSLEIDPLVQIFAVLAGGEIGGIVGALISVPVVAILRIIWRRIHMSARTIVRDGETYTAPTSSV